MMNEGDTLEDVSLSECVDAANASMSVFLVWKHAEHGVFPVNKHRADFPEAVNSAASEDDGQPCKVCGDKSSGLHYGVTSCEGCKGFFRRSIQKQIDYRCMRNGKCDVNRMSRNRCQYCRFKKCLAVGMSKDSVRYGRIPRRLKAATDEDRVSDAVGSSNSGGGHDKEIAIYDVILTVSQAHHTHCMTTQDKINVMKRHSMSLCQVTSSSYDEQKCGMWQTLAKQIAPAVQRLVEFSKHVPGFAELCQDDQLILIKSAFFEMWLTRLACLCGDGESDDILTLSDGLQIPRVEIESMYSVEFVEAMFSFAHNFNALKLSDTEIGLFSAIVLTATGRVSLADPKKVEKIQDRLIEALNLQITRNHPNETALFGNVLMKLPDLRTIGANHGRELEFYRSHWDKLRLPPLVAEIYDIPKTDGAAVDNNGDGEREGGQ